MKPEGGYGGLWPPVLCPIKDRSPMRADGFWRGYFRHGRSGSGTAQRLCSGYFGLCGPADFDRVVRGQKGQEFVGLLRRGCIIPHLLESGKVIKSLFIHIIVFIFCQI